MSKDALAQAWSDYNAGLEEARLMLEATPRMSANRAQAYLCLHEAQAMAYNLAIAPRLDHPRIYSQTSWHSHFYSLGQNGSDFKYGALVLDGKRSYRLSGRLGALKVLLMQVHNQLMGHPQSKEIGNYDFHDFELGPDGRFEATLSADPQPGNWIRLDADSGYNFVLLRRIFASTDDDLGELDIEPLDSAKVYDDSPAAMATRIDLATHLLRFMIRDWTIGLYDRYIKAAGGKNRIAYIAGQALASDIAGSPSTTYGLGIFELTPDTALIVELDPPQSAYWSFQLGDVWSQSLDFMHHQIDINMQRAAVDADGRFRAVIALEDPGVANWLDPVGHREGTVVMRNYRETGTPSSGPTLRVVPLSQLQNELPPDTRRITPEQRRSALEARRRGYMKLYGE